MSQKEEPTVYLGYIEDDDKVEFELNDESSETSRPSSSKEQSQNEMIYPWLVNKIGGTPIFPYSKSILMELETLLELIKCKNCKSVCPLIFQINSPIDESPHERVMQVYTCIKGDCTRHSWFAVIQDPIYGPVVVCREHVFFDPYYLSVMEEPTGKENFAKNNLEALKLASKFSDPDLKPAPIEEKYKNLKNYKPPKPPANLSDLDDFEKFQMEKLYGNDKDMYRFYKRVGRYPAQVCRYDWEGQPLLNSNKIKPNLQNCPNCSSKRKFEFQLMSALINYLKTVHEFDREAQDFSSILIHSCFKNCSSKTFHLEDTFFVPDPDSRIFNKVKQRMLALKLGAAGDTPTTKLPSTNETDNEISETSPIEGSQSNSTNLSNAKKKKNKKKKRK